MTNTIRDPEAKLDELRRTAEETTNDAVAVRVEFQAKMLEQALDERESGEMMSEEVTALLSVSSVLLNIVRGDTVCGSTFEGLDEAKNDLGTVFDEQIAMERQELAQE